MSRMPKIPKNRSDKEMFVGYVEDDTLESRFKKAEKEAVQKKEAERKKQIEDPETPADLLRGGFSKELTNALGKELMALKLELASEGVRKYSFKISREGGKIILEAKH